ncbi:hypothetical protein EUGRSUZ_I01441 [Eucalyptus grandis]|uniref:Uncharacterized protein n=2 Tax=Eucalyptus grandis TaxID=71139 RepID=A0ACC3JF81_EUCGR|nr:hypothetical protein EUGRSUZ_I01441 [Eucalyptus grandis]
MEAVEDIVIVGAGIAGLTTALGLHRLGIRSLVLESSDGLRTTGFAFTTWTNAWRALDALGIGEPLRQQHNQLFGLQLTSTIFGISTAERQFDATGTRRGHEVRGVQRRTLLETLANELPSGTIRYSSKVVSIEESGFLKLVHLSDGSILKAKFFGEGVRFGFMPCDDKTIYWFFTFYSSSKANNVTVLNADEEMEESPAKMKQFMLQKLGKIPDNVRAVFEKTELDNIILSPLKFRPPWEILWGNISKTNVCVTGDAFHPMTPDIGQGGCSALEDGVVLARCLGEALRDNQSMSSEEEYKRIEMGLRRYAKERRWRAFELISTAYMVGYIQQGSGKVLNFLRDRVLATFLARQLLKMASFDCGKLSAS